MRTTQLFLSALVVGAMLTSCGGETKTEGETAKTETTDASNDAATAAATWNIDPAASDIHWDGHTAGANVYGHNGVIRIKEGTITTEGEMIKSGNFVVDMTSIQPMDENYGEENPKEKLVGHLSSADFFAVDEHPTATFTIKSVDGNTVTGDLTIRGKTNEEKVTINEMEMMPDGTMRAQGTLTFDRQKYDVAWEHFLEDTVLSDDIKLEISVIAKKA